MKNFLLLLLACVLLSINDLSAMYRSVSFSKETDQATVSKISNPTIDDEVFDMAIQPKINYGTVSIIVVVVLMLVFLINFVFSKLENYLRHFHFKRIRK